MWVKTYSNPSNGHVTSRRRPGQTRKKPKDLSVCDRPKDLSVCDREERAREETGVFMLCPCDNEEREHGDERE